MKRRSAGLYLVRHGHTLWNETGRYQGHSDVPLSPAGRDAVKAAASSLARIRFNAMYYSDLLRAVETAEILAGQLFPEGIAMTIYKDLREINFGAWEGLTYAQISRRWGPTITRWLEDPASVTPPEGERLHDFEDRVISCLKQIALDNLGQCAMVVTHGGVIAVADAWLRRESFRRVQRLPVEPSGWLKLDVDLDHLPPRPSIH